MNIPFPVEIHTPARPVFAGQAEFISAEDDTGSFGIMAGHAEFLAVLRACIAVIRLPDGGEKFVALDGGVLAAGPQGVRIAAGEAHAADALEGLEAGILEKFRQREAEEEETRRAAAQMELEALRRLCGL